MGVNQSKVKAIYLPAQSGKTKKMNIRMIQDKSAEELFGTGSVNFIISSNNVVLVEQTKKRVQSDLQQVFIGEVYSWRSGKKDEHGKCEKNASPKELAFDIITDDIDTVVMCANGIRIKHLAETIQELEKCSVFLKKINIWIDEADASIKLWQKYEDIVGCAKVQHVTFVSATFKSIFKRYGTLNVIGYDQTHPECYRCFEDCQKVEVSFVGTTIEYVKHVVTTHDLAKPGVRAFIPGDITISSHNDIALFLQEQGFVVVIMNGERKEILLDGRRINLSPYISSDEELNLHLAKLYHENHWETKPFAITGHSCVSRGITFQSYQFRFTHGIIPPITEASSAYQVTARMFGNIGDDTYVPPTIYTTPSMMSKVKKQESCAIHIAKIIADSGENEAEVGEEEVKYAMNYASYLIRRHQVFDTQEEARTFIKTKFRKRVNLQRSTMAPECLLKDGQNPSVEKILSRWWGIDLKKPFRLIPTLEEKWCVYWNEPKAD